MNDNLAMTVKEIYNQTKGMPALEKARLVDLLLSDLDKKDPVIEKAWVKEVVRRKDSIRSGKSKPMTYQQVMGKYK